MLGSLLTNFGRTSQKAVVVDPYDPPKLIEAASKQGVELSGTILTTHHHHGEVKIGLYFDIRRRALTLIDYLLVDHSGGNQEFVKRFGIESKVYGGSEQVPKLTHLVGNGDKFMIGDHICITCLSTPCHTQDSICYFVEDVQQNQRAVFTGLALPPLKVMKGGAIRD